jgi:DNA polymerase III sliding clamp (beta) subunit (PCNA family)
VSAAVALIPAPVTAPPTPVVVLRAGDLSAAIAPHKPVVAQPVLPHHALVHLVARDASTVTLRTCDGRLDLTTKTAAEVSGRVDVLCDAAELAEVVARMDSAKPLRVEAERAELRLTQGRRTVRLARVEGELLSSLCDPAAAPSRGAWYQVEAAPLAAMVRAALRMASRDTTRASLFGVQCAALGRWAYVATSDGVRVITMRRAIVTAPEGLSLIHI